MYNASGGSSCNVVSCEKLVWRRLKDIPKDLCLYQYLCELKVAKVTQCGTWQKDKSLLDVIIVPKKDIAWESLT